jgi:hypothetical protein
MVRVRDPLEKVAEFMQIILPALEERLARLQKRLPDPLKRPVTSAIVVAYIARLRLQIDHTQRGVEGLRTEIANHPNLTEEIEELESWIAHRKHIASKQMAQDYEDAMGDYLVSTGRSYTKTKEMLRKARHQMSARGAPNKRTETLRLLDAKLVNAWSYRQLAAKMCDCGAKQHNEYCAERIRKRLKELEAFLGRYKISYRPSP